jgi:hypothetical protein
MSKVRLRHEPRDDPGARCGVMTVAIVLDKLPSEP